MRVCLAAAQRAKEHDQAPAAAEYYEQATLAEPQNALGYLGLAQLQSNQQRNKEAITTLNRGLDAVNKSDQLTLELTLVSVYLADGELADAGRLLDLAAKQVESVERRLPPGAASPLRSTLDGLRGMARAEATIFAGRRSS